MAIKFCTTLEQFSHVHVHVFASSSDWFIGLSKPVVIG